MAVSRVQVVNGTSNIGTTVTANITVAAGALVIATVCLYEPGAGNPTCSGVAGIGAGVLTFQQDITRQGTSTDSRIYKFSNANTGAGTYTITGTVSLNAKVVMYVEEVAGAATASYTDGAGVSAVGSSANPASGNFSASVTDGYWSGGFLNENGSNDATVAAGSGWSMDTTNGRDTSAVFTISGVENRANPGSVGPFTADFVAASAAWVACVFVYKSGDVAPPTMGYLKRGATRPAPFRPGIAR